jgi:hypothetical protein
MKNSLNLRRRRILVYSRKALLRRPFWTDSYFPGKWFLQEKIYEDEKNPRTMVADRASARAQV